jgi:hypothetical protein
MCGGGKEKKGMEKTRFYIKSDQEMMENLIRSCHIDAVASKSI